MAGFGVNWLTLELKRVVIRANAYSCFTESVGSGTVLAFASHQLFGL